MMKHINTSTKGKIYPLFVAITILVLGLLPACKNQAPAATEPPDNSPVLPDRVDIICFYRGDICPCLIGVNLRLERVTQYVVETYFHDELASGRLTFEALRWEDEANAATVEKYGASTLSLFINEVRGDTEHIEALPEIWTLLSYEDDAPFVEALKTKIEKSLRGEAESEPATEVNHVENP
jgi:hypothetical protein